MAVDAKLCCVVAAVMLTMLAASCSKTVTQEQAEEAAKQFVYEHVRFFARNGSTPLDIAEYEFSVISVSEDEKDYTVMMHVIGRLGNETKEKNIPVKVDKATGAVVELNGQKVLS